MLRAVIDADQGHIGRRIRRGIRIFFSSARTDVGHMSVPATGPFNQADRQTLNAADNMRCRDRVAGRDKESSALRAVIGIDPR
jgi:hypothetical protein